MRMLSVVARLIRNQSDVGMVAMLMVPKVIVAVRVRGVIASIAVFAVVIVGFCMFVCFAINVKWE